MSDASCQSFTDKAGSAMKPDSQKRTMKQAGDFIKGKTDSAMSSMQPNKSGSQRMGDTLSGNSDKNSDSLLNKAKNAVGMGGNNDNA